jgi:hypothetical protein
MPPLPRPPTRPSVGGRRPPSSAVVRPVASLGRRSLLTSATAAAAALCRPPGDGAPSFLTGLLGARPSAGLDPSCDGEGAPVEAASTPKKMRPRAAAAAAGARPAAPDRDAAERAELEAEREADPRAGGDSMWQGLE